ncbi:MAG: ABC transporter permease subunit [Oscillospiraceae bacterium]|jgi:ABC-2 type transport system permease protein|nr:ABC transporter permease subunit [Oscillospiraceae bacterium]MCI8716066.1 ABC transporter permease subunit [Oscillospiraceae bacterium]
MGNLLHAGLSRLVRSRIFLLAVLAELAYTALVVLVCWDHYATGTGNYTLESVLTAGFGLMGYLPVPSLIAAPLLSLHLGAEYSDGTLRNKLIVGHTRTEIYLSDLLTCVIAAVGLDVLYLLLAGALCAYPVLGMAGTLLRVSPGQLLAWVAVGLLARAAWAAAVKLTVTLLGSRTSASIAGLLLVLAAAGACSFGFHELEYLARHPEALNLEGRTAFWQLALDTLPTGQYLQISRLDTPNLWRLPLLSLAVAAAVTGAGLVLFRRKDLK